MIAGEYLTLAWYLVRPRTIFLRRTSRAMGDNVLLTALLPALRAKYPDHAIVVETRYPQFFINNPHVALATSRRLFRPATSLKPRYRIDTNTRKPILRQMLDHIGPDAQGEPRLYLSDREVHEARQRFPCRYFAICPEGKMKFAANRKEWGPGNFQKLCAMLMNRTGLKAVQIGVASDSRLDGAEDCRGMGVRQSAVVVANAVLQISPEGGWAHVARAVGVRSTVIYGGCIDPFHTGYEGNLNVSNRVDCSPCYVSDKPLRACAHMKCMKGILVEDVLKQILDTFHLTDG